MTVEAYLRARVPGYPFELSTLQDAAFSPALAKPTPLQAIDLADTIEDKKDDEDFLASLKYATSSIYYSISGVFSGGSRTEQMGNIRASQSGYIITQRDRDWYRRLANRLREELGAEVEADVAEDNGAFNATYLREKRR